MLLANTEYFRVIAKALNDDILPELNSENARATLQATVQALQDLSKREHNLPAIIAAFAPEGLELLRRVAKLLQQTGEDISLPADPKGFAAMVDRLDQGVKQLLVQSGDVAPTGELSGLLRDVAQWEDRYYMAFQTSQIPVDDRHDENSLLTADTLATALRSRLGDSADLTVKDVETVPGGFVHQTLFFTLERPGVPDERLVVRKKSAHPILHFWAGLLRDEFKIVNLLHEQGLPVPRPLWLFEDNPNGHGAFYVMARGEGRSAGSLRYTYSAAGDSLSEGLMLGLAEFLGRLHSLPLEHFSDYMATGDTRIRVGDTVAQATAKNVQDLYDHWLRRKRLSSPSEAYMLDWLRRNIPEDDSPPVLVHGDCFIHNLLVDDDQRITIVADWETAHLGSPATDLAYIKAKVEKYIDWGIFVARYREAGGPEVNEAHFPYYNALLNYLYSWGSNIAVARTNEGYHDIKMLPLSSEYFTVYLHNAIESMSGAKTKQEVSVG